MIKEKTQQDHHDNHVHHLFVRIIYFILRKVFGPVVRLVWIKKYEGIQNIPKEGPVIVAFNHQSYFDFLCFIAVSPRNIHFLSAEKFFTSKLWLPIMLLTGQIKVDRQNRDKRIMHKTVAEHIKLGKMIGIFPEGTRAPDPVKMNYAFTGVAKYAVWHNIPLIPVGLQGTYEVMSRFDHKPKFKKCVVIKVGEPIDLTPYTMHKMNKKAFRAITDKLMLNLAILSLKEYPHVGIHHLKKKKPRKDRRTLAVFDFDNTLIVGQGQQLLLSYLKQKGLISSTYYYKILAWFVLYKAGVARNPQKVMNYAFRYLKGKTIEEVETSIRDFYNSVLSNHIYQPALDELIKNQKDGNKVIIISNSIEPIISEFCARYGIHTYYATKLKKNDLGYTGEIEGKPVYGKQKVELLSPRLSKHKLIKVYSDHISDLPLFNIATEQIVVNPDSELKKIAKEKHWKVI